MAETPETGLVYIHPTKPIIKFVGCGVLVEGGYVATCRHVWRVATDSPCGDEAPQVEIEYPRSRENGVPVKSIALLTDACEEDDGPAPDLVLLQPGKVPSDIMALQLSTQERFEVGPGYTHARIARIDPNGRVISRDGFPRGDIDPNTTDEGLRQFVGHEMGGFWFTSGSSGSPVFVSGGQQLAGMLSLSELGVNEGKSHLHVAFVVPATTIHGFLKKRAVKLVAAQTSTNPATLERLFDILGMKDAPVAEISTRLGQFIAAIVPARDEQKNLFAAELLVEEIPGPFLALVIEDLTACFCRMRNSPSTQYRLVRALSAAGAGRPRLKRLYPYATHPFPQMGLDEATAASESSRK